MMNQFSQHARACIEASLKCHAVCLSTAMTHCIETGGRHSRPQHLRVMLDCAATCSYAADIVSHKSQIHDKVCALAADVCDLCAAECDQLDGMEDCASACREAASACRTLMQTSRPEIIAMASQLPPSG